MKFQGYPPPQYTKDFVFCPKIISLNFFKGNKENSLLHFFKYSKRHNISLTLPKQKQQVKAKFKKVQNDDLMTIPEIGGLMFLFFP